MKILVISDSHGKNGRMELAVEQESPLDMLIHLGDLEGGEDLLEAIAPCPVEIVCGNNDFFSAYPREKVIEIMESGFLCAMDIIMGFPWEQSAWRRPPGRENARLPCLAIPIAL